jgi:pantothenate kinase
MERYVELIEQRLGSKSRILIGIFGIPGAGKSTFSKLLLDELSVEAAIVPMDGFHYYKRELDSMEDPAEAHRRRGAPFTFNVDRFLDTLTMLRSGEPIACPSFDHKEGDPAEKAIVISPSCRVILVEGLYLGLKVGGWNRISALLDSLWMISIPLDIAMERVARRHVRAGIAKTIEEGEQRAQFNDREHALYIMENSKSADVTIVWDQVPSAMYTLLTY